MSIVLELEREEFAEFLGFSDWESLIQRSLTMGEHEEVAFYVTKLSSGEWAFWDNASMKESLLIYESLQDAEDAWLELKKVI